MHIHIFQKNYYSILNEELILLYYLFKLIKASIIVRAVKFLQKSTKYIIKKKE